MINFENGEIKIFHKNFIIKPRMDVNAVREAISPLIVYAYSTDTGFTHINCWIDIEENNFIYATLHFSKENQLYAISLFPQYQEKTVGAMPSCGDLLPNREKVKKWYDNYFQSDTVCFPWGKVIFGEGNDPIYYPPCIYISFLEKETHS